VISHAGTSETAVWAVVTRPAPDHAALIEGVEALGLRSLHSPVFVLEPCQDRQQVLGSLTGFDIVIVTSPATARFVVGARPFEILHPVTLIAPGAGTAAPLRAAGLAVSCPSGDGTSEAVLKLPELESIEGCKVAILGAPGGRMKIAAELERRGAHVQRMHLYRRRAIAPDPRLFSLLASATPLVLLISSVQIVESLAGAIPPEYFDHWRRAVFVVSSVRVEQSCRAHGLVRLIRAGGASADELLDGLKRALVTLGNPKAIHADG